MPPSPSMRRSPGRAEPKAVNHKRGHSVESRAVFKEKDDDDLALFNEVQSRERDHFLLDAKDEFEDICSTRLRCFSEYKRGISIPARGESSELLNDEGNKNDYDWLLTPPDTPLFPSLDDDEIPPPVNVSQRGRPRSQPISISRSSTMEMSHRSSRGSASPGRLSPSPRSSNNSYNAANHLITRGRTSSPSPTRNKKLSSPPPPTSSALTPRRLSTGSSGRLRGTSPVKSNRGNSASPKIRAWQSNLLPGFSMEAPPNLRTSLADRPTSYVRGSSPASGNGSRSGRKSSMSPVRSVSSTYSHDRDRVSSYGKCSVASSGDDDTESLQSTPASSLDPLGPRSFGGTFQHNKALGSKKKMTRITSSSSAPKRSIDMTLRQMDQRKSPHNMFRPLLSSVPSSTFYSGKASGARRSLGSLHSSVTTSSNASSDQGICIAHDTEASEQNQDINSEHVQSLFHDSDIVFALDNGVDALDNLDLGNQNVVPPSSSLLDKLDGPLAVDSGSVADEGFSTNTANSEVLTQFEALIVCSKCSKKYSPTKPVEEDPKLCPDCKSLEAQQVLSSPMTRILVVADSPGVLAGHNEQQAYSYCENQSDVPGWDLTSNKSIDQTPLQPSYCSSATANVAEGAGISLLLKRCGSGKGHIVQNRTVSATSIAYDDLSYVRDSVSSLRSSFGHGSASASSSSVDIGSTRQMETGIQRQSSGRRKPEAESYRNEVEANLLLLSNKDSKGESICRIPLEPTSHMTIIRAEETSAANFDSTFSENGDILTNSVHSLDMDPSCMESVPSTVKEDVPNYCVDNLHDTEIPEEDCFDAKCGVEIQNDDIRSHHLQSDGSSGSSRHDVKGCALHAANGEEIGDPVETDACHRYEESTVVIEGHSGVKTRSLTLEEATDTILFCSSLVHNLAYKAADIAISKESSSQPTLTVVGKASPDRRGDLWSRTSARRNSRPSQKVKPKVIEPESQPPPNNTDCDEKTEKSGAHVVGVGPTKDDALKPPPPPPPPKQESKCNCTIM
ncbi:hypothetical protein DM860_007025 [Cuscuta australis]|uniref:Uncharacterized protein n=1 Tax=Cuscuta australis TaxID=267555 RepID=A0A328E9W7_9ASTE|nr:hypothetical protein DM860_007025 [Cuscuta australis]